MIRLAIFTTHPIQYQVPWFRALAATPGVELRIFFSYLPRAAEQGVGFGTAFTWDIPLIEGYDHRVLSTVRTPASLPGFARRWATSIGEALRDFAPDAVLVMGWQEISLLQALMSARLRRLPLILRGESNNRRLRPPLVAALHRRLFGQCDAFLAIGEGNAALYRQAGVENQALFLAPYFVDNERFASQTSDLTPERAALREKWGIQPGATCFAFVGKLESKKNVMHFLGALDLAYRRGGKVHGLVVGSGEQGSEARAFVAAHNLPVTFAGFLNQSEIPAAYVAADMLVLPSDYGETWGLVVNEAAACGRAAAVSDRVGCAGDLVLDGETGRVFPFGDIEALAAILLDLADDRAGAASLGMAAQARVTRDYTIPRAVTATLQAAEYAIARYGR